MAGIGGRAAFLNGADRRLFRDLAVREGFGFIILACEADPVNSPNAFRSGQKCDRSTGCRGGEILNRQLQDREPLNADEQSSVIVADSTEPQASQEAFAAIQDRLASMSLRLPSAWAYGGCFN